MTANRVFMTDVKTNNKSLSVKEMLAFVSRVSYWSKSKENFRKKHETALYLPTCSRPNYNLEKGSKESLVGLVGNFSLDLIHLDRALSFLYPDRDGGTDHNVERECDEVFCLEVKSKNLVLGSIKGVLVKDHKCGYSREIEGSHMMYGDSFAEIWSTPRYEICKRREIIGKKDGEFDMLAGLHKKILDNFDDMQKVAVNCGLKKARSLL